MNQKNSTLKETYIPSNDTLLNFIDPPYSPSCDLLIKEEAYQVSPEYLNVSPLLGEKAPRGRKSKVNVGYEGETPKEVRIFQKSENNSNSDLLYLTPFNLKIHDKLNQLTVENDFLRKENKRLRKKINRLYDKLDDIKSIITPNLE